MAAGPGQYIFAHHFLRADALEVAAGHTNIFFASLFTPDTLEVAAGPGEHIFARHFLRLNALEVAAGPGEHILHVTFCARTRCVPFVNGR